MKPVLRCAALLLAGAAFAARADVITDWNVKAAEIITEAKIGTPPAIRVMAIVQTAAYDAVNAITRRYPAPASLSEGATGASIEAAVAAAHRVVLLRALPAQQASIEAAYQAALGAVADGVAKTRGIAVGEKAAGHVLVQRADDGAATAETYRPQTTAGTYVPTAAPAVPQWPQRKPWLMTNAAQFRPGPPPTLTSETWARDYNEIKTIGAKASTVRSAEQSDVARFWEYSLPAIYHGVVRSIAAQPGRDVTRNARLFAQVAQGMDDAMIGVFEAKYHYNFWRPATAIRNGDIDGHDGTQRDASWLPLIEAPLHPEYPSAHSTLAGVVGVLLKADTEGKAMPVLSTASPTAKGATRRWNTVEEFVQEVADSRVYAGIHYRTATEAGSALGRRIGELVVKKFEVAD